MTSATRHPGPDPTSAEGAGEEPAERLATVLIAALRALGDAGEPEAANRLAGLAWAALRVESPRCAQRVNGLMHRLARQQAATPIAKERPMSDTVTDLDVRTEPPARRHELIFQTFEALDPGQAFVLVNDHDPKPLYYQFEAEKPNGFSWDYLEQGPEVWRVRIGRTA